MQNDRFFLLLYYSFLCNFTSIYVFFLEICKKYIKYALKFLLKLLLTISLWRIIPISYVVYFYFTLYFIEGARKKEFRSAKFCAANASLSSDIFICVCVCILAERFCIIGKFGGLSYDTKTFTDAKVFWIRFANFSRVDVFPVRRIADAVPAGLNDFLSI